MKHERSIKRIGIVLVCVLSVLAVIPNVSATTTIGTMNYLGSLAWGVSGNVSLSFNSSDTGTNDIAITYQFYSNATNSTFYSFQSNTIIYDYTFVNNTKIYYYDDNNSLNTYAIYVDYSSIIPPANPLIAQINALVALLEQKNQTIADLNAQIASLQTALANAQDNVTDIQDQIDDAIEARDQAIEDKEELEDEIDLLEIEVSGLETANEELENENTNLTLDIGTLNNYLDKHEETINQIRNPWAIGITHYERNDYGSWNKQDAIYIGSGYAYVLGVVTMIILGFLLYTSKVIRFEFKKKEEAKGNRITRLVTSKVTGKKPSGGTSTNFESLHKIMEKKEMKEMEALKKETDETEQTKTDEVQEWQEVRDEKPIENGNNIKGRVEVLEKDIKDIRGGVGSLESKIDLLIERKAEEKEADKLISESIKGQKEKKKE